MARRRRQRFSVLSTESERQSLANAAVRKATIPVQRLTHDPIALGGLQRGPPKDVSYGVTKARTIIGDDHARSTGQRFVSTQSVQGTNRPLAKSQRFCGFEVAAAATSEWQNDAMTRVLDCPEPAIVKVREEFNTTAV